MMISCPCCSQQMLRCARKQRTYWYCPSCRQEMPDLLNVMMTTHQSRHRAVCSESLDAELSQPQQPLAHSR